MAITSALVLYAVIWFRVMLIALPIGLRTQGDEGDVLKGTHAGSPVNYKPRQKALIVTGISFVLWVIGVLIILYSGITWQDIDWTASLPSVADM